MSANRKRGRARLKGEHYTWRSLWTGAETLQRRGKPDEAGNWWLTLSAMLLVVAALEAYLNYLGPELCPEAWADEKATFGFGAYRGTLGKLAFLMERCGLTVDRGRQPWQTLKELNRRRDQLVHPRSEEWDREVEFADPSEIRHIDPEFFALVDDPFLSKAMAAIETVCQPLHDAARRIVGDGPAFGPSAFRGMVGHQGGSLLE